jgi:hypothetical protein
MANLLAGLILLALAVWGVGWVFLEILSFFAEEPVDFSYSERDQCQRQLNEVPKLVAVASRLDKGIPATINGSYEQYARALEVVLYPKRFRLKTFTRFYSTTTKTRIVRRK